MEKKMLLQEQILSFKSNPQFGIDTSSRETCGNQTSCFPVVRMVENPVFVFIMYTPLTVFATFRPDFTSD